MFDHTGRPKTTRPGQARPAPRLMTRPHQAAGSGHAAGGGFLHMHIKLSRHLEKLYL